MLDRRFFLPLFILLIPFFPLSFFIQVFVGEDGLIGRDVVVCCVCWKHRADFEFMKSVFYHLLEKWFKFVDCY